MATPNDIERARAWAEGALVGHELIAFEADMRSDEDLERFARDYLEACSGTVGLEFSGAQSSLLLSELELLLDRDAGRVHGFPRRAAAAAVLVAALAGAACWGIWSNEAESTVTLVAIPLEVEPPAPALSPLPAWFSDYRPVDDGEVRWISSLTEGALLAELTGAPLIVWGVHPTCPFCKRLRETTLRDPRVLAAIEHWVPVQLDVMQTQYFEGLDPMENGFPVFELRDSEFVELSTFYGYAEPEVFAERLEQNLPEAGPVPTREDLKRLTSAGQAEQAGRMAEAVSGYRALAGGASMAALRARAEDGLERIAQGAGRALVAALTDPDPAAALGQASRDFGGTKFGLEFERILAILLREGELPELRR